MILTILLSAATVTVPACKPNSQCWRDAEATGMTARIRPVTTSPRVQQTRRPIRTTLRMTFDRNGVPTIR